MTLFNFEEVTKIYGDVYALNKVSFSIEKGTVVGLIGRNGSGKTTALKMMANLLLPTNGSVKFCNRTITFEDNILLQNIGTFFDPERSMYWRLSGIENLSRIIELRSKDRSAEMQWMKVLLQRLNLYEAKDKMFKDYSKGMKAKLLLVSCFIGKPEVILLDEPFEGLDFESKLECINILKEFRHAGGTIIMTSHNLLDLQTLCDQVLWFQKGEIVLHGEPDKVVNSIPGEGVIHMLSHDMESVRNLIKELGILPLDMKQDGEALDFLSSNIINDFDLLRSANVSWIKGLEMHVKGLEDLYYFSDKVGTYYEEN